jgi:hypothetical protein
MIPVCVLLAKLILIIPKWNICLACTAAPNSDY